MAIVCRKCAHANADGAQFCARPGCGDYLGWQTQAHTGTIVGTAVVAPRPYTQSSAASIRLAAAELVVAPGGTATTTATIHNGGSQVEEFTVSVIGPAAAWANVEPSTLRVYPGDQVDCTIRFAPPMHASVTPGHTSFAVSVLSSVHRALMASTSGVLDVGTFHALRAALIPQQSSGRGRTVHRVEFTNDGNQSEAVRVRATDPTGTLQFGLPPTEMRMAPGTDSIDVSVTPPRRFFGRPQNLPFQLTVTTASGSEPGASKGTPPKGTPAAPLRLDGVREGLPVIAGWVPKLGIALAALAVVAVSGMAIAHAGPFHTTPPAAGASGAGGPASPIVTGGAASPTVTGGGATPTATLTSSPTSTPTTPVPSTESPTTQPPGAPTGPDAGAVGDLQIRSQGPRCDFIPNGSLNGGDEVSVAVHVTWTGNTLPKQLVPLTATTTSGDSTSLFTAVETDPNGLSSIQFVPRPADFGTTLQIAITLDPDNLIPETDPNNNVTHVSFPLPGPRPSQTLTDLPCMMF